jgi:hypothetical protein
MTSACRGAKRLILFTEEAGPDFLIVGWLVCNPALKLRGLPTRAPAHIPEIPESALFCSAISAATQVLYTHLIS